MAQHPSQKDRRINEQILAKQVSVISHDGENLGVIPTDEAIRRAAEKNLDLVEIGVQE